jgi:hypothetical protein
VLTQVQLVLKDAGFWNGMRVFLVASGTFSHFVVEVTCLQLTSHGPIKKQRI